MINHKLYCRYSLDPNNSASVELLVCVFFLWVYNRVFPNPTTLLLLFGFTYHGELCKESPPMCKYP